MDPPISKPDIMDAFRVLMIKEREKEKIDTERRERIYTNIYHKIIAGKMADMRKEEKKNE